MSVGFKLHDFGFRGVSSVESAGIGDAAHLTQFIGTDVVAGLVVARDYYGEKCAGFSIPASEHSTMTSWGREPTGHKTAGGELAAMRNMLVQYPKGLVAIVSDSYNIWDAATTKYGVELKEMILAREGTMVVRPDSGPPALIDLSLLVKLGEAFSAEKNDKGYKELPPQLRMIQGDGIDHESLAVICALLEDQGWSMNNIAFGSGGGLLQKMNRDTQQCAFKCSYAQVSGIDIDVSKSPIHSSSGKASKAGRLTVNRRGGTIVTLCGEDRDESDNLMEVIFENGVLVKEYSWNEIKTNSAVDMALYEKWGPAVEERSNELFERYKSSDKYQKDIEKMRVAEPEYKGPY
jgi:nicotinamide phosphoribosyltransferase